MFTFEKFELSIYDNFSTHNQVLITATPGVNTTLSDVEREVEHVTQQVQFYEASLVPRENASTQTESSASDKTHSSSTYKHLVEIVLEPSSPPEESSTPQPIRAQYSSHVTPTSQSESSTPQEESSAPPDEESSDNWLTKTLSQTENQYPTCKSERSPRGPDNSETVARREREKRQRRRQKKRTQVGFS